MDWSRWYLIGAVVTLITLFRKPTSLMAVGVLLVVTLFWPVLWLWVFKAGVDYALAKVRRGGQY